jgi:uncharacterized membrane protein
MSSAVVLLLRAIHILSGVCWVGAVVFIARFLLPSVRAAGPAGGAVMSQLGRRLPIFLSLTAIFAVLSGLGLYWRDSGGFTSAWLSTPSAMTFGTGGALAIVGLIVGASVNSPAGKRMGELAGQMQRAGGPPSADQLAEMQKLQGRLTSATTVVATLLLLATLAMAVARYV